MATGSVIEKVDISPIPLLPRRQGVQSLGKDLDAAVDLLLRDHQGWCQPDDVLVGRLGQQALLLQDQAQIPCRVSVGFGLVDHHRIQQALPTDRGNGGVLEGGKAGAETLAQNLCALREILVAHNLECCEGDCATQWIAAVGRAVGAGLDREHDFLASQDDGDGVDATRDSLSEENQIWFDAVMLVAEELSGAGETW